MNKKMLIKGVVSFKELVDVILDVKQISLEYIAVAIDVNVENLSELYNNNKELGQDHMKLLLYLFCEACLFDYRLQK